MTQKTRAAQDAPQAPVPSGAGGRQRGKREKSSPDYSFMGRAALDALGAQAGRADSGSDLRSDQDLSKPALPSWEGGLYIVALPIGNLGDISLRALATLAAADVVYCEDTRVTGGLLARYEIKKQLVSCHDHNEDERLYGLIQRLDRGEVVALVSDAGTPLISDPGYKIVRGVRAAGHAVTAVPGASAVLTALCLSALPTDRFAFEGFLPTKSAARRRILADLARFDGSLVFYESPHRLAASLADMADLLGRQRHAVVARELTKLFEQAQSAPLADWIDPAQDRCAAIKGEVVIVVGPPVDVADTGVDLDAALMAVLESGGSVRDAVAAAMAATGMKRAVVYARALALQSQGE